MSGRGRLDDLLPHADLREQHRLVVAAPARPGLAGQAPVGAMLMTTSRLHSQGRGLWGVALGAATYAYYLRRRGRCPWCGRT